MATPREAHLPRLAVTLGDLAGVGPELIAQLLSVPDNLRRASIRVIASRNEIEAAAAEAGVTVQLAESPNDGSVVAVGSVGPRTVERGVPSTRAGERCIADLRSALHLYRDGHVDAIMFGPLNKSSLRLAGMAQEDELRWFADELDYHGRTSELNVLDRLWTARVTSHIPLKEVASHITAAAVRDTVALLARTLSRAGITDPRIAVCALNPHAGENGNFGREEIDEIAPGVEMARANVANVAGPLPSDTLFGKAWAGDFDGVVTMYHDQGQIALKTLGFDRGVTLHGGLPVLIGTPSSGTAFDIVGKGLARPSAAQRAFEVLTTLAARSSSPEPMQAASGGHD